MKSVSILFIHRSVGQNLLDDGGLPLTLKGIAKSHNISVDFKDINNNTTKGIPGDDSKPSNYADYFERQSLSEDLVIIKSCYPNNSIRSNTQLEELKRTYVKLIDAFLTKSNGRLMILTTPPLRPLFTTKDVAQRARSLASWLSIQEFGNRVSVFNFYDFLAEENGRNANTLRMAYRRFAPYDNHPNKKASRAIAPLLADSIISVLE